LYRAGLSTSLSVVAGYVGVSRAFPILTYHRVNRENDPFFPSLAPELFERQMSFVARAYVVRPVEELVERVGDNTLPRNALAITFDDGYRDNLTHAAPILSRYGLTATIFLATGAIGTRQALWFDQLALAFKVSKATVWVTPWGGRYPLTSTAERLRALGHALERLKGMADEDRLRSLASIREGLDASEAQYLERLMLTWDDVHVLTGLGMRIGAHTVTHPILSRVGRAKARSEIEGSRDMIAAVCGRPPRAFAYPNGRREDYTESVAAMVRDAGYTCAVTTRFGVNSARTPFYELRRGGPWEPDLATFALKLATYRLTQA
jgi:peptidoglycan/xylan/chitin deacetylase (PgdA/CDA1 family)